MTAPRGSHSMKTITLIVLLFLLVTAENEEPSSTNETFQYINDHSDEFIKRLHDWVAIKSDSCDPHKRRELIRMMKTAEKRIKELGGTVKLEDMGEQQLPHGITTPLPPVILGQIGKNPKKPTVCFYGHLDVQPAKLEDGWSTDPFVLTERNENLFGRGTSDDKGQVLAVLNAIEALQQCEELPVNIKFLLECMEEVGSPGLFDLVKRINTTFFANVSYIVVTDSLWLSNTPGITYGTRGNCYFYLEVKGAKHDLHSGSFGGVVFEAMNDLIFLLSTLVDSSGRILIPGIYDAVPALSAKEMDIYERTEFDCKKIKAKLGINNFTYSNKEDILIWRSHFPSLSIHGIEGAFSGPGTKTVIPSRVIGKFSLRLAPNMEPSVVIKQVTDYLQKNFAERKSPNHINITAVISSKPWLSDVDGPVYLAARKAIKNVFETEADLIRAGGTVPIVSHFEEVTGKSIILLGIGGPDDSPHGQNEKISRYNYIKGTKLYASFLKELAACEEQME